SGSHPRSARACPSRMTHPSRDHDLAAREDAVSLEPDRNPDGGLAVFDRAVDDLAVVVLDTEIDGHLAGHELPLEPERPVAYPTLSAGSGRAPSGRQVVA